MERGKMRRGLKRAAEKRRTGTLPSEPLHVTARERVRERLEAERGSLAEVLQQLARGLEHTPAPGAPLLISRQALAWGGRMLGAASDRLRAESAEQMLENAREALRKNPWLTVAGLAGLGALAARIYLRQASAAVG